MNSTYLRACVPLSSLSLFASHRTRSAACAHSIRSAPNPSWQVSDAITKEIALADVNGDHSIEPAELSQILAHLFPQLTMTEQQAKTAELMTIYDDDHDGTLDSREVRHCLMNLAKKIPSFASESAGADYAVSVCFLPFVRSLVHMIIRLQ